MSKFQKRHTAVGARPGTLVLPASAAPTRVRVMQYGADAVDEYEVSDCTTLRERVRTGDTFWIDVQGLESESTLRQLADAFSLHPLALEDVVNIPQRPKVEVYPEHLLLITRMARLRDPTHLDVEQVALFVGSNYVLMFQERPGDVLDPIRRRIREGKGRIRQAGPAYLAYAVLDAVIDAYYPVFESLGEFLERLEDEAVAHPTQAILQSMYWAKRELLTLRRCIWPQREMLNTLLHGEPRLGDAEVQLHLRDTYDHCVQLIDATESYRELIGGLMDLYLSSISIRQNEVMKMLTVMASIFIPLSFLAGVYGMNFENMPALHSRWGYPLIVTLMALTAGGMLTWFWRAGWLQSGRQNLGAADPEDATLSGR